MEVGVQLACFILVAILSFPCALSQVWEDPPFLNDDPRDEILHEPFEPENGRIIIYMDEEIPEEVILARINYAGLEKPVIIVTYGDPITLGAVIRQKENKWYLVITERQDYEIEGQQRYTISVKVQTRELKVFLNIRNIDDNEPAISGPTCQVPELFIGRTTCKYLVEDRDGEISIRAMNFYIEGRAGEEDMFDFFEDRNDPSGRSMEVTLETVQELDYALSQMHIFTIVANDSAANEGRVNAIVQVIDMPNMPPIWKSIFASQTFPEKTHQSFTVVAVDGDTQINKRIFYKLIKPDYYTFFSIGTETGILDVQPIDRDTLEEQLFPFTISAYKEGNESWAITSDVLIIITDVNDNKPTFLNEEYELNILEETFVSLEFNPKITVHDRDLLENAQYTVELVGVNPPDAERAFIIIPGEGYQKQGFQILIMDASALDYENITWQHVELEIRAVEKFNEDHFGTAIVKINLENWNDEEPIFDEAEYFASFEETVESGYEIETPVHATDRDIDDNVIHSLVGSVNTYLKIDSSSGVITVTVDNAFDFDRQNEIIVQVKAKDVLGEPFHEKFVQLSITLIDVNNKQPEIQVPQSTISVAENTAADEVITTEIGGFDIDSDAEIEFTIDWGRSTASKPGKQVQRDEFVGCVEIKTVYTNLPKKREASGHLVVREIRENVTIDFEEFEFLYLAIVLTDKMQTIGPNSTTSMLTLFIEDVNDNAPVWVDGTLSTRRIVRELADKDVVIGSVMATDRDGPLYNNVKYYLEELGGTPGGLVVIDITTGQLSVGENKGITCDHPDYRYNLSYNLIASDCDEIDDVEEVCFRTPGEIEIAIIDVNNKSPIPSDGEFENYIEIYENETTGYNIAQIIGFDYDRDVPYHTIWYAINFEGQTELRKFFSIDPSSGQLIVDLENGEELDRDEGDDSYEIYISMTDNPMQEGDGQRNSGDNTMIKVQLLDINDNAPELPKDLSWTIRENTLKGVQLTPVIIAPDKDQPDHDNSRVQYNILSFSGKSDLFNILSPDNKTGILETAENLKKYWGSYTIFVEAYDLGDPSLSSNMTYDLKITPYNFDEPSFVFPIENAKFRLKKEDTRPGSDLYNADKSKFRDIEASDDDGLEAGIVTFEIIGKDGAEEYFQVETLDNNRGKLTLAKDIDDDHVSFQIVVRATDKGQDPGSLSTEITFSVKFVPTDGDPYFDDNAVTIKFTELEAGLGEHSELGKADDPKNIDCILDDCFKIYYYILKDDPSEASLFKLDKDNNVLSLDKELNREDKPRHTIRIAASNSPDQPNAVTSERSILNVEILVKEANPMPRFQQLLYGGGIALTDVIGKLMFTLKATHTEDLKIKYSMVDGSMVADPSLQAVVSQAFLINDETGDTLLNFKPQDSMMGKFEFKVSATDTDGKVDIADVKIFMIAEDNRVSFLFENLANLVREEQNFIAETFTSTFGYHCNIDYVLIASVDGVAQDNQTEVRTHFIENNTAVSSAQIAKQKSDPTLMRNLREVLRTRSLYLEDISSQTSKSPTESLEQMLQIVLIVVSSVLGTLCIVLSVAFCLRTKSLKRRLDALSTTKFGSQDSGLNRIAAAVPGTNKHALEGSNPVWNEEIKAPDFDAISNASGDSDLIGIEDNPYFSYENTGQERQNNGNTFEKSKNGVQHKGSVPRRITKSNIHSQGI